MLVLKYTNLALRFLLELCALVALGYWGFHTGRSGVLRLVLGLGVPVLAAVMWGVFGSPRATIPLSVPAHRVFEAGFFGIAIVALAVAGRTQHASVFALAFTVNSLLLYVWNQ